MRAPASLLLLLIAACTSSLSSLSPKKASVVDPIEPSAAAGATQPHFEYQTRCGKPCKSVTLHWLLDGSYQLMRGEEPAVAGSMTDSQVTQLSALYRQLRELTQDLPSDLSRAKICSNFATDHAVKTFAAPATVDGWRFKDNLGCTGFDKADALRQLEGQIELLLPVGAATSARRKASY